MAAAIVVCIRSVACSEFTAWIDLAEALEAERVLCDPHCGPHCEGQHTIVCAGGVRRGSHDTRPLAFEEELAQCYPREEKDEFAPERAPTPAECNPPLVKPRDGSVLTERFSAR